MSQSPQDDDPTLEHAQRFSAEIVELNERIARLALSLGAPISTETDLRRILGREVGPLRPDDNRHASRVERHAWEELRGLLNMRCDLMARTLEHLGLDATRRLTELVEDKLRRDGFEPGTDGFQMHRWLDAGGRSG